MALEFVSQTWLKKDKEFYKGLVKIRVGNEHCSVFGKRLFVSVVVFGVWFLNMFDIVFGCVGCSVFGLVVLCLVFGSGVVFCSVFGPPSFQTPGLMNFQPQALALGLILDTCLRSDVGSVCVRVRVRLNTICVRIPVCAERVFVFGQRCSLPTLV